MTRMLTTISPTFFCRLSRFGNGFVFGHLAFPFLSKPITPAIDEVNDALVCNFYGIAEIISDVFVKPDFLVGGEVEFGNKLLSEHSATFLVRHNLLPPFVDMIKQFLGADIVLRWVFTKVYEDRMGTRTDSLLG